MRTSLIAALVALALFASRPAQAQWTIDLATNGDQEYQVSPGTEATITVVNRAPKNKYVISTVVRSIPIDPLPDIGLRFESLVPSGCNAVHKTAQDLEGDTSETAARNHVAEIKAASLTACTPQQRASILAAVAGTIARIDQAYVIRSGELLVVTVQRLKDGKVEKDWKLTLTTGPSGSPRTLYGLSVMRDHDDKPYLTPGTKAGEFTVNPGAAADVEDHPVRLVPSVFFTWLSRRRELGAVSVSPTLGLGATKGAPGLFAGLAFTYRQNLALVVGIPVAPERRVRAEYLKNPTVTSVLTTEQLTETRYHVRKFFVAGVFRFSSNPFAEAKKPAQEKPADAAADTKTDAAKGGTAKSDNANGDGSKPAAARNGAAGQKPQE